MKQNGTRQQTRLSTMLGKLLYIGFSVQIVFGIIWISKQLGYIQLFGDTAYAVSLSGAFNGDGDIGILYPSIILIARALGKIFTAPWYSMIYVFQLILAAVSGYYFFRETELFGKKKSRALWGSFVILTFPMITQLHMAVLINSMILSLLTIELSLTVRVWKDADNRRRNGLDLIYDLSGVALFWMLLALTKWMYIFIAFIPVLAAFIKVLRSAKSKSEPQAQSARYIRRLILLSILTVLIFLGLIIGVDNLTTNKRISKRQEFSVDSILFERMAWKSRFSRQSTWLLEITDVVDEKIMIETLRHQENVKLLIEPALEEAVGYSGAHQLMQFTNKVVWDYDRKEFLHDIVLDSAGYLAPQVMNRLFLEKNSYVTYTARNYDIFKRNEPVLAKRYMDYSLLWFWIAIGICAINFLSCVIGKTIEKRKDISGAVVTAIVTCVIIALCNVMRGSSVYDYKEAGSAMVAWFMAIFLICGKSIYDEDVK